MSFTAYTSMIVRLEIAIVDNSISVGIPEVLEIRTELGANEDNMIDAESFVIAQLEDGLSNKITEALGGGGLGGINLPVVDLSAQLGLPPGTATLAITAESVIREPGTTVIEAHFQDPRRAGAQSHAFAPIEPRVDARSDQYRRGLRGIHSPSWHDLPPVCRDDARS